MASDSDSTVESSPNRRQVLQSLGAATVGAGVLGGATGTATASECDGSDGFADSCYDQTDYLQCEQNEDTFSYVHENRPGPDFDVKGKTAAVVGKDSVDPNDCYNCEHHWVDVVGNHEAFVESDGAPKLTSWGFRFTVHDPTDDITWDLEDNPGDSTNVQSGGTDTDNCAVADDEDEEKIATLGGIALGLGSLAYPALGPLSFLYGVAQAAIGWETKNGKTTVEFNDGNWENYDSAGFAYLNIDFQVQEGADGYAEFEAFSKGADEGSYDYEHTVTLGRIDLTN